MQRHVVIVCAEYRYAKRRSRITLSMWYRAAWSMIGVLLLLAPAFATDGTFQGKVVDPPANEQVRPGWIFIQGPNRSLRRVEVTHAVVTLGPEVAHKGKRKCDWECLAVGQEIRVTAGQDAAGEWRAKRVEILRMAASNTYYSYRSAIMGSTLVALRAGT